MLRGFDTLSRLRPFASAATLAVFAFILLYLFFLSSSATTTPVSTSSPLPPHPIDHLVERADADFRRLLETRSTTLNDAAARYRVRRGRHPPPGFDAWFEFALGKNAVVVEDFFDQIYDDLAPFWGLSPRDIRIATTRHEQTIVSVRNGAVSKLTPKDSWRMDHWTNLVETIAEVAPVPDIHLPMNIMDESRLFVPWEGINSLVASEIEQRDMTLDPSRLVNHFSALEDMDAEVAPVDWIREPSQMWPLLRATCHPDSPARQAPDHVDLSVPAPDYLPLRHPEASWHGYVQNWTVARDPCHHPHLRGLHGTFIEPTSTKATTRLIPLFAGSKLRGNNEILVPAAMYWGDWQEYSGGQEHGDAWEKKLDRFVWRGVASGGRNKAETWPHFHRHRWVSMANGTTVADAEAHGGESVAFKLPDPALYDVGAAKEGRLGEWIDPLGNVGFNDLLCFPQEGGPHCSYSGPYFEIAQHLSMLDQYHHKFLPDIDGNSYSARYRAFLLSTSLPIKASIYREWHDSRLFPWVHFVPMDNTFIDFYGILDYLLAHDSVAKSLANQGQEWAQQVLRKEDMQVYMYRLILEFARVCDENRTLLAFTDDL
ncbi:KDEL motif-containing protein 1 [Lasiodiplodia hormozganensis]|uniref:KDEL motif-containing protein 1 n=1 Tax=Lasiodiplodia hormozganensis TaxID=869390 RepID=A0AA40CXX0_9PEZI|nr:KDEL motif-containing protein 1 [Lasiodiplodia hormozganensis]